MQVLLVDDDVHAIVLVVARRPLALLALLPACGRLVLERRFLGHGRTSAQPHIPAGRFTASCSSAIQRLVLLVHNSCHEDPARDDGFKAVFLSAGERGFSFPLYGHDIKQATQPQKQTFWLFATAFAHNVVARARTDDDAPRNDGGRR